MILDSALEACQGAEAVVIATEWKEFKTIDWQSVYNGMSKPAFVFDGRLLVDGDALKKIGFKVGVVSSSSRYLLAYYAPTGHQHWPRRRTCCIEPDPSAISSIHSYSVTVTFVATY